jgi:hypothetical protein
MCEIIDVSGQSGGIMSKRYEAAKEIVADSTAKKVEGLLLDLTTARVLVQLYEVLNPESQANFDKPPLVNLVKFAWQKVSFK